MGPDPIVRRDPVDTGRTYLCIDLKTLLRQRRVRRSRARPLQDNLVVADPDARPRPPSASPSSPAMKALGVRNALSRLRDPQAHPLHHGAHRACATTWRFPPRSMASTCEYALAPRTSTCTPSTSASSTPRPISRSTACDARTFARQAAWATVERELRHTARRRASARTSSWPRSRSTSRPSTQTTASASSTSEIFRQHDLAPPAHHRYLGYRAGHRAPALERTACH